MGLDYTSGCVNFRDVGEFVNLIVGKDLLPIGRIFRGGKTDFVEDVADIQYPKSIINLRKGHDVALFDADYYHFPIDNKYEKYHTEQKEVRRWLNQIVSLFEDSKLAYPVLIHCLSGKDRTGIVVAALLMILGVEQKVIEQEYLLSDGDVRIERIQTAMQGMTSIQNYFHKTDLALVKQNLLGAGFCAS